MSRPSSNLAKKERYQNEIEGAETPLIARYELSGIKTNSRALIARRCLTIMQVKQISDVLAISIRTVQKWTSGEAEIPVERVPEIIVEAKRFFMGDLNKLEYSIDQELMNMYGGRDRGNF